MTDVKVPTYSFPAFTVAALALLVCKLTAFPTISWWVIIGVWCFPLVFIIGIFGIVLSVAAIISLVAIIVVSISALFEK